MRARTAHCHSAAVQIAGSFRALGTVELDGACFNIKLDDGQELRAVFHLHR